MKPDDPKKLSDEELVDRFTETREEACFTEIVRRFQPKIRAGAFSVLRNSTCAEDISQESFLRLLMSRDRVKGGNFAGWLRTVTRNLSLNLLKRSWKEQLSSDLELSDPASGETALRTAEIRQTLSRLSRPQRICVNLFYGEGYSYQQIANLTGYPIKAVKSHIQNGRRGFRQHWKG